jgi:acetoin utilization deacetylase AcuC-like enzyme
MSVTLAEAGPAKEHAAPGHPERPERVAAISAHLKEQPDLAALARLEFAAADEQALALVHHPSLIEAVREASERGGAWFDADTYCSAASYRAAVQAVGAALAAIDSVLSGGASHSFGLARPPGHHATATTPMGFCLFNNAAIAVRHAQERGLERVAIVDIDVHHGNGSEAIFWDDPSVLYTSLHQWPLYPGTGRAADRGGDRAPGLNLNVPLPAGTDGAGWLEPFDEVVLPAVREFRPDLIVVSAGFDAHAADPLAGLELSTETYGQAAARIAELCATTGIGSVWLLEGGYDLTALGESTAAVLRGLLDRRST